MSRPPIVLAADRDPWDRQPGESQRQYSRFRTFLELGRVRTLKQALETLTMLGDQVAQGTLYQLSHSYRWDERAQAFDRDQDRLDRERLLSQRRDMIDRHRRVASALFAKALKALKDHVRPEELTPLDVVRMTRLAVAIEHQALGEPDTRVAVTGADGGPLIVDDMSGYTPEQRRARLEQIAGELARRAAVTTSADDDVED